MNRIVKQHQGEEVNVILDSLPTHTPKRDLWLARRESRL
jgi:hypothetical protein